MHLNPTPVNWLVRFVNFTIYGGLYYLNERNMLPAIIAHGSWNFLILVAGLLGQQKIRGVMLDKLIMKGSVWMNFMRIIP